MLGFWIFSKWIYGRYYLFANISISITLLFFQILFWLKWILKSRIKVEWKKTWVEIFELLISWPWLTIYTIRNDSIRRKYHTGFHDNPINNLIFTNSLILHGYSTFYILRWIPENHFPCHQTSEPWWPFVLKLN